MPHNFKALASITVWILFITGGLTVLTALPLPFYHYNESWQRLAVGIASLVLSTAVIWIRKNLG